MFNKLTRQEMKTLTGGTRSAGAAASANVNPLYTPTDMGGANPLYTDD
ncbi:MAG: hypothetical protein QNK37_38575 [Acidobacteriota bacterium]|nr:hypothetical protein [Acidobacteriota bacterium]